jgi:hypothetical protein
MEGYQASFIPVPWCGVRLSPLGSSAIVPAPGDRWWVWSSWWNENWQGKRKYSEKTCPSATSSTTNSTWTDLDSNPGRRSGKPATNCLSYDAASEVTNKTKLKEAGRKKVNCDHLATIDVLQKSGNFLPSSTTTGFSRRVLFHGGIRKIVDMMNITKYEANYFLPFCITIKFATLGLRLRPTNIKSMKDANLQR